MPLVPDYKLILRMYVICASASHLRVLAYSVSGLRISTNLLSIIEIAEVLPATRRRKRIRRGSVDVARFFNIQRRWRIYLNLAYRSLLKHLGTSFMLPNIVYTRDEL